MKKYKACVVGDLAIGLNIYSGQTVKTRDYYQLLCERYGEEAVTSIDTRFWRQAPLKTLVALIKACVRSENMVLLLCKNGRKTILPICVLLKWLLRYKILFSIIGGSLMDDFDHEWITRVSMQACDVLYTETRALQQFLQDRRYAHVEYAPVFSRRKMVGEHPSADSFQLPYRFCTYARVCREKGISIAIDAVMKVNQLAGKVVCTLDIFGEPTDDYKEEFTQKVEQSGGVVVRKGFLEANQAIPVLSQYYMMLFPTYYDGEGFPIAIVECMKAAVPVIASDWHFNAEVIKDGETGLVYQPDQKDALVEKIQYSISNAGEIMRLKRGCLKNAENFEPNQVLSHLYQCIATKA